MKKLTALIIVLMLSLSAVSCASSDADTGITTSATITESSQTQATTEDRYTPEVANADFGGYEFRVLVRGDISGGDDYFSKDIISEGENGEAINDAVYLRNSYVEDKYNVMITGIKNPVGNINDVKKNIQAGDDAYDLLMLTLNNSAALITGNMLVDLSVLPTLDLSNPWWDAGTERDLSIGGKTFVTDGDISIVSKYGTRVMFFNKKILADYGLESPYELVRNNMWTLDKFKEMCINVSKDINGDGLFDENDQYGYLVQTGITINMFYAAGENITQRDSSGLPELSVGSDRSILVLEKINDILSQKNAVMFDADYAHVDPQFHHVIQDVFDDNRGLFLAEVLHLAERMRASEVDFGILPMPKYDENQKEFYCFADNYCVALTSVPVTNTDLSRTGIIMEALAAEAKNTVTPALYDVCLNGKYTRDQESKEMLDIISGSKILSMDEMYGWGMHSAIQGILNKIDAPIVSTIEKNKDKVSKAIEKFLINMEETLN